MTGRQLRVFESEGTQVNINIFDIITMHEKMGSPLRN